MKKNNYNRRYLLGLIVLLLPMLIFAQSQYDYMDTRVRDKKRLVKVGNLVKNSYLYR